MQIIIDPKLTKFDVKAQLYAAERKVGDAMTRSLSESEFLPCEDIDFKITSDRVVPTRMTICNREFHIVGAPTLDAADTFRVSWIVETSIVDVADTIYL